MKSKNLNITYILVLIFLILGAYNNFDFANSKKVKLAKVDEASRSDHAEELLGLRRYKKSNASQLKETENLNQHLYQQVQKSLPKKYKKQARKITQTLIRESKRYEMDPVFVMAVIRTESSFNPLAVGGVGEIGLMQLKPDTAEWIAKKFELKFKGAKSLKDPHENIKVGVAYFSFLRNNFEKHPGNYVNAYNMGPRNVRRMLAQNKKPKEYALRVMKHYKDLYEVIVAKENLVVASN